MFIIICVMLNVLPVEINQYGHYSNGVLIYKETLRRFMFFFCLSSFFFLFRFLFERDKAAEILSSLSLLCFVIFSSPLLFCIC